MQLKIGKYYLRGDGKVVGPVEKSIGFHRIEYKFQVDGKDYTLEGKYCFSGWCSENFNLIEEVNALRYYKNLHR